MYTFLKQSFFTVSLILSLGAKANDVVSVQQYPVGKYLVISHNGYGNTQPYQTFAFRFFQLLKRSRYITVSRTYHVTSVHAKLPPPAAPGVVISAKELTLYGESEYSVSIPIGSLDSVERFDTKRTTTMRLSGPIAIRLSAILESIPGSYSIPSKGYRVLSLNVGEKSFDSIRCRISEVSGLKTNCDINVEISG